MNWSLLITFCVLNIFNVIVQTIKSIATIRCGKGMAALVNAGAYGLYTVVTVYMLCDLPLLWKAVIVAVCNLVGVFVVKWAEEKARKDKLWKVEATVEHRYTKEVHKDLLAAELTCNYIELGEKWTVFNIFCINKEQSAKAKEVLSAHNAKYFVSESKTL